MTPMYDTNNTTNYTTHNNYGNTIANNTNS